MLLDKEVEIKINAGNYSHFKSLNYKFNGVGDIICIKTEDLMRGSAFRVNVECQSCKCSVNVSNKNYNNQLKVYNFYSCKKCTMKSKIVITNRERYGVDFISNSKDFSTKSKKTNQEKYGSDYFVHSSEYKKIMLSRYGVEIPLKSKELHEKAKNTTFINFGVLYPKQSELVRENESINSNIKYGVYHYSLTKEYKEKYVETCLMKYGVTNVSKLDSVLKKIKDTKINNGTQIETSLISDFNIYYRIVSKLTKSNKTILYKNWDGIDYYDFEFILHNRNLNPMSRLYPTIDHKISIFRGFIDNIPPYIISGIDNLCITKRSINSSKNRKTEDEFKASK